MTPPVFTVIIPARYGSTRFPGKPLALLAGRPMILHCLERARASAAARVVVTTDHDGIAQVCEAAGAEVVMTRSDHPSGTDRLAEAATTLGLAEQAIVVNLQGDEPMMPPELLARVAAALDAHAGASMATLITPLDDAALAADPNVVKVVVNAAGLALYFSRACIPFQRDPHADGHAGWWRHLGVYAYRAGFLRRYPQLAVPDVERSEQLEQLRALWYGASIACLAVDAEPTPGIDTPEQLRALEARLRGAR
jgi:3-deoxy-manno-octulosonate cytidylyltransferase (CMP-KDO synthetase)